MDISLSEFAQFNLKSKQQILDYKAVHLGKIELSDYSFLHLYNYNKRFVTMQITAKNNRPIAIDTNVNSQILYLFAEQMPLPNMLQ